VRSYLDCYPCFLRQALDAARRARLDEGGQARVLDSVLAALRTFDPSRPPPEMAARFHAVVREAAGSEDPYREEKARATREALDLYPDLAARVAAAADPLETALRLAVAGNVIDLGAQADYDLPAAVARVLVQDFAVCELAALREALAAAPWLLFLGDNAGETVFDRLLIETLGLPCTYAVRGGAVLNDATREDARAAGLDGAATLVDNGARVPGTVLELCSDAFRDLFARAPLILSKGMGNYESLDGRPEPVFHLLQAKCPVIARDLGVPVGAIVLASGGR
jgi:uncharacterized protein with ATP-grasp and redox domains